MNKSVISIALGMTCGLAAGWLLRTAQSQQNELPSQPAIRERIRRFERQLYRDGLQRANNIRAIKQEVENKL